MRRLPRSTATSPEQPRREGREGRALSPYALSKQIGEQLAEVFGRCYGLELIGLRYFNVYGPRQRSDGPYAAVVPRFIAVCRSREQPTIYGDGRQSRDFTFVGDVVRANLLAAQAPNRTCGRAYNVGYGSNATVLELAEWFASNYGHRLEPIYRPSREGDVCHSSADTRVSRAELGFEALFDLTQGLEHTCREPPAGD